MREPYAECVSRSIRFLPPNSPGAATYLEVAPNPEHLQSFVDAFLDAS